MWVALLADADVWVKALGAYAALFVAEIVKEAAKDTWRNRAKAAAIGSATFGLLGKMASSITLLKRRLADRTSVAIGLPIPNDYFTRPRNRRRRPMPTGGVRRRPFRAPAAARTRPLRVNVPRAENLLENRKAPSAPAARA
jgi:hypothetical protein